MNAKRGYVPKDEKEFSPAAVETLRGASRHICYLINEGYEIKQASTFVGNHYSLSERQRLALARSVATEEQLKRRKCKEKIGTVSGMRMRRAPGCVGSAGISCIRRGMRRRKNS